MPLKYPSNEIQYKLGEFIQRRNPLPKLQDQIHKKTLGREICSYITTDDSTFVHTIFFFAGYL